MAGKKQTEIIAEMKAKGGGGVKDKWTNTGIKQQRTKDSEKERNRLLLFLVAKFAVNLPY
jgi:hypothetical protein